MFVLCGKWRNRWADGGWPISQTPFSSPQVFQSWQVSFAGCLDVRFMPCAADAEKIARVPNINPRISTSLWHVVSLLLFYSYDVLQMKKQPWVHKPRGCLMGGGVAFSKPNLIHSHDLGRTPLNSSTRLPLWCFFGPPTLAGALCHDLWVPEICGLSIPAAVAGVSVLRAAWAEMDQHVDGAWKMEVVRHGIYDHFVWGYMVHHYGS